MYLLYFHLCAYDAYTCDFSFVDWNFLSSDTNNIIFIPGMNLSADDVMACLDTTGSSPCTYTVTQT